MASCKIKALNGSESSLANKIIASGISDEKKIKNLHYKANTKDFSNWYGKGKRDSNGEPVLNKNKENVAFFENEKKETLTLDDIDTIYADAPLSIIDPAEDVRLAKERLKAKGLNDEQAEQILKERKYVDDIKTLLIKKKHKFQRSKYGAKKTKEIDQMIKQLDNLATTTSIHDYFSFALRESQNAITRAEHFTKKGGTLMELSFALDYVSAFGNLASIFNAVKDQKIPGTEEVFDKKYYDEVIGVVLGRVNYVQTLYREHAAQELSKKLIQYNRNASLTSEDIQAMLNHVTSDISYLSYMMDAMAESDDQVLALIDRMVKAERNRINKEMTEFKNGELKQRLLELEEFQKSRGVNLNDNEQLYGFMLEYEEVNGKKRLTGGYLSPDDVLKNLGTDGNDPRYKFAKMFYDNYNEAFAHLPDMYQGNVSMLPAILKSGAERTFEQGLGKAAVEGIKDAFNVRADDTDYGDKLVYTDENNNVIKFVPVNFVTPVGYSENGKVFPIEPTELSLNLASSLQRFMTMSRNYSAMTELVPYFNAAKQLIASRDVDVKTGNKVLIDRASMRESQKRRQVTKKGAESNAYKMLTEYLDAHVYGEFNLDAGDINLGSIKVDGNKLSEALIKYTAINSLGLNLFSGASNIVMGTLMNGIEANSSFFFSSADFRGAMKIYGANMQAFMKDASSRFTESKLGLFMESFDVFQEFNENGEVIEHKNGLLRNGQKALYFLMQSGEHFIQTTHAIAMLKGHRIYNGKALSYFEWLEETKNKRSKESRAEFEKLTNVYDSIQEVEQEITQDGRTYTKKSVKIEGLDEDESFALIERIKGNYQHNHGNYARQDAPNINRRWWGKMLMLFRKWLKPGINRRFSKKYYDQRLGHEFEGNYTTTYNFMTSLIKDFKQVGMGMVMYWNTPQYQALSEWEKAQITKTFQEAMLIACSALLATFLANLQADIPEEDRIFALSFSEFLANRVYQETFSYTNPKEFMKILRSPSATLGTTEKGFKMLTNFIGMETYKSGEHKGEYKAFYNLVDLIPVVNQFEKIMSIDDILKFQKM